LDGRKQVTGRAERGSATCPGFWASPLPELVNQPSEHSQIGDFHPKAWSTAAGLGFDKVIGYLSQKQVIAGQRRTDQKLAISLAI
jgi:hypothetical protein